MRELRVAVLFAASAAILPAQNPCEGNGVGSAYITTTPAIAGGQLVMNIGSPAAPGGIGLLAFGVAAGPQFAFCHDISQFVGLLALLDASGNAQFSFPIQPASFGATLYARSVALEGSNFSLSKVVRVEVEFPNSTRPVPPMANARSLHTCTSFSRDARDNRTGAIVIGGATDSMVHPVAMATTEVFDPLSRTWSPGPTMSVPRASHGVVRLLDGRILIAGGMVNAGAPAVGGPATASCEIYDPATNTLSATGSMGNARMGHALTVLTDGRVLASGGFADWTDIWTGPAFVTMLNTAQDTTEVWDPATGAWTAGPTMASKRSGHSQTLLGNGDVLITSGINGGVQVPSPLALLYVPSFTVTCELFHASTNTLAPAATIFLGRAFHGASLLPNGQVLVTGGAAAVGSGGEAAAISTCQTYDPLTDTWAAAATFMPTAVAFHTHSADAQGRAILTGGYNVNFVNLSAGPAVCAHVGSSATALQPLGSHPVLAPTAYAPGAHAAAFLHDGTLLVTGGYNGVTSPSLAPVTYATAVLLIAP